MEDDDDSGRLSGNLVNMSARDAELTLTGLASNYVFKDAFGPQVVYDQTVIHNLLRLLAHQIKQNVSYSELSKKLSVSVETVMRYVDLLEKAFIIFRRQQFKRNQRSEVGKLRKVYFTDLGVRNAMVGNFNPLEVRDDVGALWENFVVVERLKALQSNKRFVRSYYWRNNDQQEIEIIEEENTRISAFECKYNPKKSAKMPKSFVDDYPDTTFQVINPDSFYDLMVVGDI